MGNRGSIPVLPLILVLALAGCGGAGGAQSSAKRSLPPPRSRLGTIALNSTAFKAGGRMPLRFTCDGPGVSPPLRWLNVPSGTVEFFLLAIDLDGGRTDAIQWAIGGLGSNVRGIAAGRLPAGAIVGRNSAGEARWGGICGARGRVHHVAFLLYALKRGLGLKTGFNPALVRAGLSGATLARGLTLATYRRA